ncbi:uncharacterized protein LOC117245553 [Parus major]|uniref:uncharacterized protein LOC117245553 n=1 Tax=Parus major TaxID=9157 RepID=UPI0014445B72|nr:uncharacterized protein LOC117245553 [Parus major]
MPAVAAAPARAIGGGREQGYAGFMARLMMCLWDPVAGQGPVLSCPVLPGPVWPWRCFGAEPPASRSSHHRAGRGRRRDSAARQRRSGNQGRRCLSPWQPGPHITPAKLDTPVPRETLPSQSPPACHLQPSPDSPVTACPHSSPVSPRSDTGTRRDAATITELCSEDVPEVEIISLLGEQLPRYTLRADTVFGYDHGDWLRAPSGPPQPVAPLTPQQIEETLQYFRESPGPAGLVRVVGTGPVSVRGRDGEDRLGANRC